MLSGPPIYSCFKENIPTIFIQLVATFLIYLLLRYRTPQGPQEFLNLRKSTVERLIAEYEPASLVDEEEDGVGGRDIPENLKNIGSYDVFNLARLYKPEIKDAIRKYGVGTCGPRGFYGTLDIHEELERRLSELFGKEDCALFSNYFACLQSVVSCLCRSKNTVYFPRAASEPILRGLYNSKAGTIAFEGLADLRARLRKDVSNKYVVVERLGKNTGEWLDLPAVVELRAEFGFRLILDVGHSFPLVGPDPEEAVHYKSVDAVVGSLCNGFPSNGGFACGSADVVGYQRLSAQSYVFSASSPAFLARAVLCFLDTPFDHERLRKRIEKARSVVPGIVSDPRSPVLLVASGSARALCAALSAAGFVSGINGDYVRICVNIELRDEELQQIGDVVRRHLEGEES